MIVGLFVHLLDLMLLRLLCRMLLMTLLTMMWWRVFVIWSIPPMILLTMNYYYWYCEYHYCDCGGQYGIIHRQVQYWEEKVTRWAAVGLWRLCSLSTAIYAFFSAADDADVDEENYLMMVAACWEVDNILICNAVSTIDLTKYCFDVDGLKVRDAL